MLVETCVLALNPVVKSEPAIVIDFEEFRATSLGGLGGQNEINEYYSSYGVRFTGATSLSKADNSLNYPLYPPRSGDAVVYDWPSEYSGTMTITFDTPQISVGGYFTTRNALTFTAYDTSGNIVGTDNSLNQANYVGSGSSIPPNYYLHVDYTGGIKKVVIMDGGNTYTLDDLTFTLLSDTVPPGIISDLTAQAVSLTPTGFVYPTGNNEDYIYLYNYDITNSPSEPISYYLFNHPGKEHKWGWLARGATDYAPGKYHIAQDIPAEFGVGDPVYAIADGEIVAVSTGGWGGPSDSWWPSGNTGCNYGIFVRHTTSTGDVFWALYGHVRPNNKDLWFDYNSGTKKLPYNDVNPVYVKIGEPFATIGQWITGAGSFPHLHFGVHPGNFLPNSPFGILDIETDWPDTHGFVDPINWITTKTPQTPVGPSCAMVLSWSAPANDGDDQQSGPTSYYDIRYSTHMITNENWESATKCIGEPIPGNPGNREIFIVTHLYSAYSYHFAMKSYDEIGHPSELSNDVWACTHGISWSLCSPADIIVEDPDGLIISSDIYEIPEATYIQIDYNEDGILDKVVMIPNKKIGDYIVTVIPEPDASPTDTYSLYSFSEGIIIILADNIQIGNIPNYPCIVRSTDTEIFQIIPVTIDIDPNTFNLKDKSKWITCYIELPQGFNVSNITINSIQLNRIVPAQSQPIKIGDYDFDSIPDLMVKFSKSAVAQILQRGNNVEITVSSELFDGTRFEGIDFIRVI